MNFQQLHHLFNHLPSIGQLVGFAVLLVALFLRKSSVFQTGAWIVLISAITVWPANFTGEKCEEKVEHIEGVSQNQIHEHEEAAELAFKITLISGAFALLYLIAIRKSWRFSNYLKYLLMVSCAVSIFFLMQVSHQGGLIRHPEIDIAEAKGRHENKRERDGENEREKD